MWVVKLGGSLAAGSHLEVWLDALAAAGGGNVVVVPGGGVFADAVRSAQYRWRFSERTAHLMALHAMEQFGLMLCDRRPFFVPCASAAALRAALTADRIPVWLPCHMAADTADIRASWDITADSLAAWLCRQLPAELLLLVKSQPAAADCVELLQGQGLLDRAFADFYRDLDCDVYVCAADDATALSDALANSEPPGIRLSVTNRLRKRADVTLENTP